jgi:glycosyltransferase involved in cell wall biosynthesis
MISVFINAYACAPNMGSEPGMAWNWVTNLAKYCKVYVMTEGEWQAEIEEALIALPQMDNIVFYYNPISDKIRKMCWNQGDWRFYRHYRKWQYKTYKLAKEMHKSIKFDVLHQLNMIGFREPGYLWKIPNTPFVWGPVDAKTKFPVSYLSDASIKTKLFIHLKNSITYLQLNYSKRIRLAVDRASEVVSASSNSQETFCQFYGITSPLINETGCYVKEHQIIEKNTKQTLDLLWVGKLDFRKQLYLAIRTLAKVNNKEVVLHIIGAGDNQFYQALAKKNGVEDQCKWYGLINQLQVQELMQKYDVLFFTSVAEGTPHVVLEALSNNMPVLCFNTCGQGDSVNESVGYKISLTNPENSISQFSEKIDFLFHNRNTLYELSNNCEVRQQELSWDSKAIKMIDLYLKSMKN